MTNVATNTPAHYRPAVSLSAVDLSSSISQTISKIYEILKLNNLTVKNEKEEFVDADSIRAIYNIRMMNAITKMTKSAKKKLAKRIRNVNYKMSIRSMNTFFSFIRNKVMREEVTGKILILPSLDEQNIAANREKYKKLRAEMQVARQEYKSGKNNYRAAGKKYFGS